MGKKFIYLLFVFALFLIVSLMKVEAKNLYYINNNNVSLSKEEYLFISDLFYDGYQNIMEEKDYNNIFYDSNILNSKISHNIIFDNSSTVTLQGTFQSTASKKITISKACATYCLISIVAEWIKSPIVRSYDLMGAYLENVKLVTSPITTVMNSTGHNDSYEMEEDKNGFGVSIKLLTSGDDMKIVQHFNVAGSGHIYGTYQHAIKNITLANSKKYTISKSGYGKVFLFNNLTIRNYYDGMTGVDIEI